MLLIVLSWSNPFAVPIHAFTQVVYAFHCCSALRNCIKELYYSLSVNSKRSAHCFSAQNRWMLTGIPFFQHMVHNFILFQDLFQRIKIPAVPVKIKIQTAELCEKIKLFLRQLDSTSIQLLFKMAAVARRNKMLPLCCFIKIIV